MPQELKLLFEILRRWPGGYSFGEYLNAVEQHQIRLLALNQLALADRSVTEPQDKELEQRPVRRIRIHDQNGRHGENPRQGPRERRLSVV